MMALWRRTFTALLGRGMAVSACCCLAYLIGTSPAALALEAGAAKVEITPPLGTPLNGYGDRVGRGCTSVHDPIWARCLYLSDGVTSLFLVTSDLCMISRELRQRVLELAPSEVKPENIILTATHTHSGSGAMIRTLIFRAVSGRFVPEVLEQTAQGFANAMRAAYDARKPASLGYGTGEQNDLSTNRRYDNGPRDPQIGVIRVDDRDGVPMAIVTNFAAHPTTVSDDDLYAVSADYPGYYYTHLEKLAGPHCLAMFMNGAEGNQRPANPENKSKWGRTESIGRILAERAKAIADMIACEDPKLHVGYATPELPRTMAGTLVFPSTILQTLEINDLLLTFIPGEACVEIAIELRKRALARGYAAQFTVGLSNDYLGYFVPPEYYSQLHYESASNFYGPRMLDWYGQRFSELMTRGEPEPGRQPVDPATREKVEGGERVELEGTAYDIGYARGAAFRDTIMDTYQKRFVAPMTAGTLLPSTGFWRKMPAFLNTPPLALFTLGIGVRPLLQGISSDAFQEVEGMADGAGLPFDAMWLLQSAPVLSAQPNTDALYRAPFCTMFAAIGERAGTDELIVGRNLDWADAEMATILTVKPDTGHHYMQVGFPWNVGVFTGMNDAGVVVCAERVEPLGRPPIDGAPVEFVMRDLLQTSDTLESAVARLQAATHLRGYHVLAAGGPKWDACVVEFGATPVVRRPVKGILAGSIPESSVIDDSAKARYAHVTELLNVIPAKAGIQNGIKKILADHIADESGTANIWNAQTRHSVVFLPKTGAARVALRSDTGEPGAYVTVSLKEKTR